MKRMAHGFCLTLLVAVAAPGAYATPRVLIIGDSWAAGVWATRALDEVFEEYGLDDVDTVGDVTAVGGSTAEQWATADWRGLITQQLAVYPTIDTIHLIIGGNDVLSRIKDTDVFSGIAQYLREGWWNSIKDDVQTVVNHSLLHPQIKHVVIADYDYLNVNTINVYFTLLGQDYSFGGMSQLEVNTAFLEVGIKKFEVAANTAGCEYVQTVG